MKKKLVVLLSVVLVMCSFLCACGGESTETGKNTSAGTVTVEGTEYTIEELSQISFNNEIKFENEFLRKEATVTGKISEISGACTYNGLEVDSYIKIGLCWINTSGYEDILAELNVGDTVTVSGLLGEGFGMGFRLFSDVSIDSY